MRYANWEGRGEPPKTRRSRARAARLVRVCIRSRSRVTSCPARWRRPRETFVFTEFASPPHCFLTAQQIVEELGAAGFRLRASCRSKG